MEQRLRPRPHRLNPFAGGQRGQVVVIVVIAMVGLLGMAALVMDVGYLWYAKRQLQASTDAAALAGAQDLPDVGDARNRAVEYATTNEPRNMDDVTWSVQTRCTKVAATCSPANTVVVTQTARVPTTFARVLGIDHWDIQSTATACQPCGTAPFEIMLVVDRSGSMCDVTVSGACRDLNNAKDGIRTMLGVIDPKVDRIGMMQFPPVKGSNPCAAPWPTTSSDQTTYGDAYYDYANGNYLVDPLSNDWRVGATPNPSSGLYQHTTPGGKSSCITSDGGTNYTTALQKAADELNATARPKVPKYIVFMTDGEATVGTVNPADPRYPIGNSDDQQPCHSAISTANQIKASGITIYTIGYDLKDSATEGFCLHGKVEDRSGSKLVDGTSGKRHKAGGSGDREQPLIKSVYTLQQIASPGNFYNQIGPGDLSALFSTIAADITKGTSRLVDDDY